MKDIIRQAVADAAQYLHLTQGISPAVLWATRPEGILKACQAAREVCEREDRARQLAASSVPVLPQIAMSVDQVVVKGPGGFMTRCVVAEQIKGAWPYNKMRAQVADAAWWLWTNRDAATSQWLEQCSASNIVNAQAMAYGHDEKMAVINSSVSVPRSKLETLKAAYDREDGAELRDLLSAVSDLLDHL